MNVINVKKQNLQQLNYVDFEDWNNDDNNVYIGRNMSFYVKGCTASKWQNPFSTKKYGRQEALRLYYEYITKSSLINDIDELDGKTLGCWCKPSACHGDILIDLLNEKKNQKN